MTNKHVHVCSHWMAWSLDNGLRRLMCSPARVVSDYIKPGDQVMDLGCGPGFFTLAMADLVGEGGSVLAVDLQPEMLSKVDRKRQKSGYENRIRLHTCSVDSLNLTPETGRFDFVLAYYMIYELPDARRTLGELKMLLKPKGKVLVVEPRFHVSRSMFVETLDQARAEGFRIEPVAKKTGGRAALLAG